VKTILKIRKKEIVDNVGGENEFKKLRKVKLLKLMEPQIQQLLEFWCLGQVLEILNTELGFKISKTVFYEFCAKNLKKDEKLESVKPGKIKNLNISQNKNIKKKSILSEDELNAIAMFGSGSSSKNQLKD
jgi:hypothetical protein